MWFPNVLQTIKSIPTYCRGHFSSSFGESKECDQQVKFGKVSLIVNKLWIDILFQK